MEKMLGIIANFVLKFEDTGNEFDIKPDSDPIKIQQELEKKVWKRYRERWLV